MEPSLEWFGRQHEQAALYFPYMRVPATPWFSQVLLYWDTVASIVPTRVEREIGLDPYMRELKDVGLLECIDPMTILHRDIGGFRAGFMQTLDTRTAEKSGTARQFVRVHVDKFSADMFEALVGRGLAQPDEPDDLDKSWWSIEKSTAGAYMAYLASIISGARPGMLPVTDQRDSLTTLGPATRAPQAGVARLRHAAIRKALPAPSGRVAPRELKDFKETHADKLRRCRIHLDAKLAAVAAIGDPAAREAQGNLVLQEIQDDVATLKEQMTRKRWPRVDLGGFCGVASAALSAGATVAAGGAPLVLGLSVGAGMFAVGQAVQQTREKSQGPRFNDGAPLAYAALAGHQFGQRA